MAEIIYDAVCAQTRPLGSKGKKTWFGVLLRACCFFFVLCMRGLKIEDILSLQPVDRSVGGMPLPVRERSSAIYSP
jgi:hypothetical protein